MTRDPAFAPVLVLGASSQIGYCLLPLLAGDGIRVSAVSRWPQTDARNVRWLRGSLPDGLTGEFADVEAVACFAPLDALAAWLRRTPLPSLKRVVATSSMSAESKRESPVEAERALAQRLRDGEEALARACEARGAAWTVLRPTLIYGVGRDRSLTPLARRAARSRVFVLPSGGGLRQPVHAQDVASAVEAALRTSGTGGRIIPMGGGERLRAREMFARVRASLPVPTVPVPVPAPLILACAHLLPPLRGPLTRLEQDLVADNSDLGRMLAVQPRDFRPDPSCWGDLLRRRTPA
ncbi:MAG TPA: NAD-dependent epimerase/dehydratase family protein [Rhodanobacteraceae bacterium]|nr:NAD-dependent epimerase/dehydratase family protein [Rhodanobacteraceae bacterium]